jgi:hypothetical protein
VIENFLYSLRSIRCSPFPASSVAISSLETLRGRSADRRNCPRTTPREQVLPPVGARGVGAPYGARTPTGAPPRHLRQRTNATAQLQPCFLGRGLDGRHPSSAYPSPARTAQTGHHAGRMVSEAARERVAKPPAGTALAPSQGSPRETPSTSEIWSGLIKKGRVSTKTSWRASARHAWAKIPYSCWFPNCASVRPAQCRRAAVDACGLNRAAARIGRNAKSRCMP